MIVDKTKINEIIEKELNGLNLSWEENSEFNSFVILGNLDIVDPKWKEYMVNKREWANWENDHISKSEPRWGNHSKCPECFVLKMKSCTDECLSKKTEEIWFRTTSSEEKNINVCVEHKILLLDKLSKAHAKDITKIKKEYTEALNDRTKIPKKVYKYCPINKYTLENLTKNQIYFNNAKKLNDMFELYPPIDYRKITKPLLFPPRVLREVIHIACFSEINDSASMWAHYAKLGQGICIEYVTNEESPFFKVHYLEERPKIISNDKLDFLPLCAKSKHWNYEKEWRIFYMPENESSDKFLSTKDLGLKVSGIYFGNNCSPSNIKKITSLFPNEDVKFSYASPDRHTYEILFTNMPFEEDFWID
ncbi:DUF2971 domain-containing protein [Spiroplasma platyhelix]|uniref:DUF2971 domain-containing protein n=1 Tax=Spiroplasma platyhelix PALS-1 TaxID=1276218 RepID=A0A846U4M7_9MOLU|nr:DUF2971 domain-containing protein [Spiroplasma platyhelix]MBE4704036.1 hypothetical protein [Spiroplasma platyhelix PALS-1]NKE38407.1 DUF2971 domain-containing protein [Spiroplasma platyhelix PALS-1]UJB29294.1 hypothetical protein SPLAT_v1c05300 [Spiroplasma platyhelix PALS-1]